MKNGILLVVILNLYFLFPFTSNAQWSTNPAVNNVICNISNDQEVPSIVSDGIGGAIIAWSDLRSASYRDIYAQRISGTGAILWSAGGKIVCNASFDQQAPSIVADGYGGAIITWIDKRTSSPSIYAQRINASGIVQWTANGVPISVVTNSTPYNGDDKPEIVSDGNGGAKIVWWDNRSGNNDIYAQRVNSSGTVLWAANGVPICAALNDQSYPEVVPSNNGKVLVTWREYRNINDDSLYVQCIDSMGVSQWATNGVAIYLRGGNNHQFSFISDNNGGAIIAYCFYSYPFGYNIAAQRVNSSGTIQWIYGGVVVSNAMNDQTVPMMAYDSSGGVFIVWSDNRNGNADIYAQFLNNSGVPLWTLDGLIVCSHIVDQLLCNIMADGSGGVTVLWTDQRTTGNPNIYGQNLNNLGSISWSLDGNPITTANMYQGLPDILPLINGEFICVWQDDRNVLTATDIYAQKVFANGTLCSVLPPAQPLAFTASSSVVCRGQTGVTYTVPNDPLATNYIWTYSGSGATITGTTNSVSINYNMSASGGTLGVKASNSCGTSIARNITINVNTVPSQPSPFTTSSVSVCKGQSGVIYTVPNDLAATSYIWSYSGTGVNISGTSNSVSLSFDLTATSGTLTVQSVNVCGTSLARSIAITVNSLPSITANTTSSLICAGNVITLTGGGAQSYTWNNGATDNSPFTPSGTQTYTVTGLDANGCFDTSSIVINVKPLPVVTANATSNLICGSDIIKLTGSGAQSYYWNNGIIDNSPFTISGTQTYTVTGLDANGCADTANILITVNPTPTILINASSNIICSGNSITLSGTGGQSYTWNNGISDNIPFSPFATQTYTVTGLDANGCTGNSNILITVDPCNPVWPGDANNDLVANNNDLLNIGLGYGITSYVRVGGNNNWSAQPSFDWPQNFAGGLNFKHADCDGNGVINDNDTLAISLNYGQTHLKVDEDNSTNSDPVLRVQFLNDSVLTDEVAAVQIILGNSTVPANNVYGISFTINYNSSHIKPNSTYLKFTSSWLGALNTEMISIQKDQYSLSKIDAAVCRKDHNNVSGSGLIGVLYLRIQDNLPGNNNLFITLSDIRLIDNNGTILNVQSEGDNVAIKNKTIGIAESNIGKNSVLIYPNPAKESIYVKFLQKINKGELILYNMLGNILYREQIIESEDVRINANYFANGIYTLELKLDDRFDIIKKVSIMR